MARRFVEKTLHTGRIAYLEARGLVELSFPVLIKPIEPRYDRVVARSPVQDEAGLFYRVWEPTRAMQAVATDVFRGRYKGRPERLPDDGDAWDAVRRIHHVASVSQQETRQQARQALPRVAAEMTKRTGERIGPVTLAAVAEYYRAVGALVMPGPLTASVVAATLLLMVGVPREHVAVFGMYYQDPTRYRRADSGWRAGFVSGTPYYTVAGVYLGSQSRWLPLDFTLLAQGTQGQLAEYPGPHLRHPDLGPRPDDGAPQVIDYLHPHTMVFAPAAPGGKANSSPLLWRIPLLQLKQHQ